MPNVCIITDSTAQFTQPNFPGHACVHVIPVHMPDAGPTAGGALGDGKWLPPTVQEFMEFYARLSRITDSVLVVTHSSQLSLTMQHARQACDQCNCSATVEVVDSRTTSIGLGMLIQDAARAAAQGATLKEIDQRLRTNLSRVYMLFCIPELTCLANSGFMDRAQAQVGEMLGILPIFTFDEGRLAPLEKVRTPRHLWEVLQEFLEEFENPDHISLVRSLVPSSLHIGPLHHFINDTFPETRYTEHTLSPQLAALFGPQSIGLAVWDSEE